MYHLIPCITWLADWIKLWNTWDDIYLLKLSTTFFHCWSSAYSLLIISNMLLSILQEESGVDRWIFFWSSNFLSQHAASCMISMVSIYQLAWLVEMISTASIISTANMHQLEWSPGLSCVLVSWNEHVVETAKVNTNLTIT